MMTMMTPTPTPTALISLGIDERKSVYDSLEGSLLPKSSYENWLERTEYNSRLLSLIDTTMVKVEQPR